MRAQNVIDAGYDKSALSEKIDFCLYNKEFRQTCLNCDNPYGMGDAGVKIAEVLSTVELSQELLRKGMTLRGEEKEGWFR